MQPTTNEQLYNYLKELNVIDEIRLNTILERCKDNNKSLADELLGESLISDDDLGQAIASILEIPFINLSKIVIEKDVLEIVPREMAQKELIIAFERSEKTIKVATYNPTNKEVLSFISKKTNQEIELYFATKLNIKESLKLYKKSLQESFNKLVEKESGKTITGSDPDLPVDKIVELLIEYAYQNRASDIHIEPWENYTLIRFRIDGELQDVLNIPPTLHENIVSKIKLLAKLRTDEHLAPQDGKIHMKIDGEDIDLRVSVVPVIRGEEVELRLLTSNTQELSLSNIGLSEEDLNKVKEGFTRPYGMVLSTGPTGSGKTTSIYTVLKTIDVHENNVDTIEDPVEYNIEGVNQIQVNPQTDLTFAKGLRAILRQDPNIIFVGEIRDPETASIAVNAAMTGHLVLSTLHTNTAATTIPRLIDMGVEPFLIASTVNVIIGQKLVRRICDKCIYSDVIKIDELKKYFSLDLINKYFQDKIDIPVYKGKGCPICQSIGYRGRIGIFEVMKITKSIKDLIIDKADADKIFAQALSEGMISLSEDGLKKALQGITSIDEIIRVTKE